MENVTRKDKKFAGAAMKGLYWTVIDEHVFRKYPALLRVFDASRNAAAHVATPESEVTGMNKLFLLWAVDERAGRTGSYVKYLSEVLGSRPPWASHVQYMVPFLQNHVGGSEGLLWKDFMTWHSHNIASGTRCMSGIMFQVLAKVQSSVNAYAILKAAYNCPENQVLNRFCNWITVAEVSKLIVTPIATDTLQKIEEKKGRHREE